MYANDNDEMFIDKIALRREYGPVGDSDVWIKKIDLYGLDEEDEVARIAKIMGSVFHFLQEVGFDSQLIVDSTLNFFTDNADNDTDEAEDRESSEEVSPDERGFKSFMVMLAKAKDEQTYRRLYEAFKLYNSVNNSIN
jgi:hypothetical protein